MRNISDGYSIPPRPGDFSNGTPAQADTSPSPVASMNTRPRTAARPDFDSMSTASIASSPAIARPTAKAWKSGLAPELVTSSSAAIL